MVAAKSIVTLDVKPWDDETNMEELEANVRAIEKDGLVWGASTLVAIGYGIKKLQINLVVEDAKISLDELQQQIEEDEDHVQSTDVCFRFTVAFLEGCGLLIGSLDCCYAKVVNVKKGFLWWSFVSFLLFHD